jgi:hypothetical protein
MTMHATPSRTVTALARDHTVGFAATLHAAEAQRSTIRVDTVAGGSREVTGRVDVGPFPAHRPRTSTWCDPVTRTVGRGPLSPVPLFYGLGPGGDLAVATSIRAVVTAVGAEPSPMGVVARLAGMPLPPPVTPYREVYRLPAGARIAVAAGRVRLSHDQVDWEELVPPWSTRQQRSALVTEALRAALAELPAGWSAQSGGLGSAALAAADAAGRGRVHVRLDVPMLDRRIVGATEAVELIDGTARWHAMRDAAAPPYPEHCDPWTVISAQNDAVCGQLLRAIFGPNVDRPRGRLRAGWALVTAERAPGELAGKRGLHAFTPRRQPRLVSARVSQVDAQRDPGRLPAWLSETARSLVGLVMAIPPGGGHLIPGCSGPQGPFRGALLPLMDALDSAGIAELGPPDGREVPAHEIPAHVASHPAVIGAALRLRIAGRSGRGHHAGAPALRELLPDPWLPADPPASGRERLLAADLVSHRLADPATRQDLLEQAVASGWAEPASLVAALESPGQRLRQSLWLHRLWATIAAYPDTSLDLEEVTDRDPVG